MMDHPYTSPRSGTYTTSGQQYQLLDEKQAIEKAKNEAIREIRDIASRLQTTMILIDDKLAQIPYMRGDLVRIRDDIHEIAQQLKAKGLIEINMSNEPDPGQKLLTVDEIPEVARHDPN